MIPVIAIPSIIYFCADKYTSTTGNITILHAAISTGQSVKYNPLNVFSIKGRVNFSCEFKNNIGYKKLFQFCKNEKINRELSAGLIKGRVNLKKIPGYEHPSIFPASIIESGKPIINCLSINIPKGNRMPSEESDPDEYLSNLLFETSGTVES